MKYIVRHAFGSHKVGDTLTKADASPGELATFCVATAEEKPALPISTIAARPEPTE